MSYTHFFVDKCNFLVDNLSDIQEQFLLFSSCGKNDLFHLNFIIVINILLDIRFTLIFREKRAFTQIHSPYYDYDEN